MVLKFHRSEKLNSLCFLSAEFADLGHQNKDANAESERRCEYPSRTLKIRIKLLLFASQTPKHFQIICRKELFSSSNIQVSFKIFDFLLDFLTTRHFLLLLIAISFFKLKITRLVYLRIDNHKLTLSCLLKHYFLNLLSYLTCLLAIQMPLGPIFCPLNQPPRALWAL